MNQLNSRMEQLRLATARRTIQDIPNKMILKTSNHLNDVHLRYSWASEFLFKAFDCVQSNETKNTPHSSSKIKISFEDKNLDSIMRVIAESRMCSKIIHERVLALDYNPNFSEIFETKVRTSQVTLPLLLHPWSMIHSFYFCLWIQIINFPEEKLLYIRNRKLLPHYHGVRKSSFCTIRR